MISKLWFKVWILHMIRRSLSSNLISNRCMECQEEATTLLENYFSTKWQFPCFLGSQFLDSHFNINTHLLFHSVPISKNDLQTQNIVKDNVEVDKTYVHVSHHLKIFATTSLHKVQCTCLPTLISKSAPSPRAKEPAFGHKYSGHTYPEHLQDARSQTDQNAIFKQFKAFLCPEWIDGAEWVHGQTWDGSTTHWKVQGIMDYP